METVARVVRLINAVNRLIGRPAAWLILGTVLICAAVALMRYGLGFGRIWIQELYVALFSISFMLIAGYVYACNQHVRVDVVSSRLSELTKARIEIFGVLFFLFPWLAVVFWVSVAGERSFVTSAWLIGEGSPQAGGLPGYYLLKALIPVFCVMMALQGLAAIGRSLLILGGREDLLPAQDALMPSSQNYSN
jgi:TRAP-type mannitol/chloroaromatic compound transport system permease small subunit